jgi:prolyl 4-hydroxylase
MPGTGSAPIGRRCAGDRDVRVVMAMAAPRVVVFADLLSADECAELIALARAR